VVYMYEENSSSLAPIAATTGFVGSVTPVRGPQSRSAFIPFVLVRLDVGSPTRRLHSTQA